MGIELVSRVVVVFEFEFVDKAVILAIAARMTEFGIGM